ncbi:unnamed protein product [Caenorhabditis auriculariae]|uniref:S1 motif domain-containing protein n=1 Tax=Caenorhabditis auriculariae TaxID=2777116 RepID=A0A8S1GYD8_9PELO|nr:unnamed protein product [Caenorhabditis auriculariae]
MRVAANLTMLFTEVPLIERYAAAARAGFKLVEVSLPYSESAETLKEQADKYQLQHTLINAPTGDWSAGFRGLASLSSQSEQFEKSIETAIEYAKTLKCPRVHVMAGIPLGEDIRFASETYSRNIRFASERLQKEKILCLIEPINTFTIKGYHLNSFDSASKLLDELADPNLKIQYDIFHAQQINGSLTATMQDLHERIGYIQVAQVPNRDAPNASGEINFAYVFECINKMVVDKSSSATGEVYFPRGGGTDSKPKKKDTQVVSTTTKATKGKAEKRKLDTERNVSSKKKKKDKDMWTCNVSDEMFLEGLMGVGVVQEVFEDHLFMETMAHTTVELTSNNVSPKFSELFQSQGLTMSKAFTVGQMVPFKVINRKAKDGNKHVRPKVTCDPHQLNSHLTPKMLSTGLVLHSIVISIEEKGAILDLGMDSLQGFVEKESQPQGIFEGQPLIVRIESVLSRVVRVSTLVEQDNLSMGACEKLKMDHLMPGTILDCEPTDDEPTASGITVTIGNGIRGTIQRRALPTSLRENVSGFGKSIRAVVMMCQQNSNILVLNAHQDIVAVSKPQRRTNFEGISVGDKIQCKVFDVIKSKHSVCFSILKDENKKLTITAIGAKAMLDKSEKIEEEYKIGSLKECRVIGMRYVDRCLLVATRRDILKQPLVSYKDAVCGDVVEAKVTYCNKSGIYLNACNFVRAFIPLTLISPKTAKNYMKKLSVDTVLKCVVWDVNEKTKQIILTNREEIVNFQGSKLKAEKSLSEGNTYPTTVLQIFEKGSLLLRTFRGLRGVLPHFEAALLQNVKVNDFVEAKVKSIDSAKRVNFTLGSLPKQLVASELKKVIRPNPTEHLNNENVFSGVAKSQKANESVTVEYSVEGQNVEAVLENSMIFDSLDAPLGSLVNASIKKMKFDTIVPLGTVGNFNRACAKGSVATFMKEIGQKPLLTFQDLKEKMVLCAVVHQKLDDVGTFVEICGGSGLVALLYCRGEKMLDSPHPLGHVLIGEVVRLNKEKKLFCFNLVTGSGNTLECFSLTLLKNIVDELSWAAKLSNFPVPGTQLSATVSNELDEYFVVRFSFKKKKMTGILHKSTSVEAKVGEELGCIAVENNYSTNEVLVALASDDKPRVVSVRKDYVALVSKKGLIYMPTRLHPNHVPSTDLVKVGDSFSVKTSKHNEVLVGHRKEDEQLAASLEDLLSGGTTQKTSFMVKTIKNLSIYTGVVVGEWKTPEKHTKQTLFAKISLPGGHIGRMHVSEMPSSVLVEKSLPLEAFLGRNLQKEVIVRVIGFVKAQGKERIAELTMREAKINSVKAHASELGFKTHFKEGERVMCFGMASSSPNNLKLEINSLWTATVPRENVGEDLKALKPEGGVIDMELAKGEMRFATVTAVNKKQKTLAVSFEVPENRGFSRGQCLTGRVFEVQKRPLSVRLHLSSGLQAILSPTAVSQNYESVANQVANNFAIGQIAQVYAFCMGEAPRRYYVVTEERFSKRGKEEESDRRRLISDRTELKRGQILDGFVTKVQKEGTIVEIGPGVRGKLNFLPDKRIKPIAVNSVVAVQIQHIDKESIVLNLEKVYDVLANASLIESETKKKKKDAKEEEGIVDVEMEDPGFDWSNSGFRNEDLATVGKLSSQENAMEEKKKAKAKDSAKKENLQEEDEKMDDEEFAKMLRNDPNSAMLWIRYMSFFLEKDNLSSARATAERALETISYREDSELFNLWTAYLNMEVAFGDEASVKAVFDRACQNADSFKIHKQLASIYDNAEKHEEARQIYDTMVRKFRSKHIEVWYLLAEHDMRNERQKEARELLQRALSSVPKQQHTQLITKFAQLEFKSGDTERGKTLFEGLVNSYPKNTQLWLVYADAAQKYVDIELARNVLERACAVGSSMHMLRPLYKKWLELEQRHGDADAIELVRAKAEKYLQSVADAMEVD